MSDIKFNEERKLNARVFRRTAQMLVLLWDKVQENVRDKDVEILFGEDGTDTMRRIEEMTLNQPPDMVGFKSKRDVVICVLDQEKNKIEPDKDYIFEIRYGNLSQSMKVYGVGILPDREREDKEKNRHGYGWNKEKSRWQKFEGIEVVFPDGEIHFCQLVYTGPMKLIKSQKEDVD